MKRLRIGNRTIKTEDGSKEPEPVSSALLADPVVSRLNALATVSTAVEHGGAEPTGPTRVKRTRFRIVPASVPLVIEEESMDEVERVKRRAQEAGRPPADVVHTPQSVISRAIALPWYVAGQRFVAGSEHYDYPIVHLLARVWLSNFLREPWLSKGERPCFNLDRDPLPHEGKMRCVVHKQFGFRLRELLFDASVPAPTSVPELCYLCHLYMYLLESIAQRSNPRDTVYIVNKFMVIVDEPGEYAKDKMLTDETGLAGLWGFVPIYNENNYVLGPLDNGLRTIKETDNLLFRLPRALSQQTASHPVAATTTTATTAVVPVEGRVSIRSSRTGVGSPSTFTRLP